MATVNVLFINPPHQDLLEVPEPIDNQRLCNLIGVDRIDSRTLACDASTGAGDVILFDDAFLSKPELAGFTVRVPGGTPTRIAGKAVIVRCDAEGQYQTPVIDPRWIITFDKP